MTHADILVIGAGIAGASIAYELAARRRVVLLERESQPGYHTTGRSAALYAPAYGNPLVRALTRASRDFFAAPPPGFTAVPLLNRRGAMFVGTRERAQDAQQMLSDPDRARVLRKLTPDEAIARVPILRAQACAYAYIDDTAQDIDTNALHRGYLRAFAARGGTLLNAAGVRTLVRQVDVWVAGMGALTISAPIIVNAAGAWADEIAQLARLAPLGVQPLRRTALTIDAPAGVDASAWPAVIELAETFYFKPDAGRVLLSPADETPSAPCDAQPEEWDVAVAIDHFERATTHSARRVLSKWAGLRTFAPDRSPVVGFDARASGFFWMAGQGGYGLQMAPALARTAAALLLAEALPEDVAAEGVASASLDPARLFAAARL